ncbi:RPA-related protein RADX-like isoform X1 [Acipenser ruthenus]|uniref:RPA-related protein RADX-like isoform X1 n=1 Tax=Acipenser ruthenus TaxID=7906 RepID=UPI002742909A|nr:RPA-related protein RADX-like isoform X1 [Acipenser ruthenus]
MAASLKQTTSEIATAFDKLLSSSTLRLRTHDAGCVSVVAVERYVAVPGPSVNKPTTTCYYSYDVTVTDGVYRAKCQLAPELNSLVHKCVLRTGVEIRIVQCSFLYNEKCLRPGCVLIEGIEFGSERSPLLQTLTQEDVGSLPFFTSRVRNVLAHSDGPLKVEKKHYLPLWNNDDPYGVLWKCDIAPPSNGQALECNLSRGIHLCDLELFWGCTSRFPPVLVRVMYKSRLRFFGKPDGRIDIPYQAYFEVADCTGLMSMVLWNGMCPEWYQKLHVGTVILVENYAMKQAFGSRTQPTPADPSMTVLRSTEISVNTLAPAGKITIIPQEAVKPEWKLPDITYKFVTRCQLDNLSPGDTCDVIGLVTFVGRCERIKKKDEAERYWTYRWVHIVDDTTEQPFILEIFASSQPEAFSNIYPMSYLVCTQMRVVGEARGHTMNYLTSSNESQVYCAGYHRGQPYVSHPRVKSFIKWTKTLSEEALLRKTVIGGYYRFPHSPDTFTPSSDDSEAPSLTSTSELQQEMEELHYREHRCLAVQGFIAAVRYVAWPAARGASRGQPEQPVPAAASSSETQELRDQAHQGAPAAWAGASTPLSESGEQNNRTTGTAAKRSRCPYNLRVTKRRYCTGAASQTRRVTKSEQDAPTDEKTVQADPRKRSRPQQDDSEQPDPADCQSSSDTLAVVTLEEVPSPSWECGVWSAVQQHLSVHLNHSLHSASVPRKFDYKRREFLMQQHNLHPAKWQPPPAAATACDIEEFIPVCNHGYYVVTIMGVNQQVAVDAVFLPVMSPDDPRRVGRPQAPHDNTLLSCLTEGFVSPESTGTAGWGGARQSFPSPGAIMQTAGSLDRVQVICLLDLYQLGGGQVEVFLNKLYRLTDIAVKV